MMCVSESYKSVARDALAICVTRLEVDICNRVSSTHASLRKMLVGVSAVVVLENECASEAHDAMLILKLLIFRIMNTSWKIPTQAVWRTLLRQTQRSLASIEPDAVGSVFAYDLTMADAKFSAVTEKANRIVFKSTRRLPWFFLLMDSIRSVASIAAAVDDAETLVRLKNYHTAISTQVDAFVTVFPELRRIDDRLSLYRNCQFALHALSSVIGLGLASVIQGKQAENLLNEIMANCNLSYAVDVKNFPFDSSMSNSMISSAVHVEETYRAP